MPQTLLLPVLFQGGIGYFSPWRSAEFSSVFQTDFVKLDLWRGGSWMTIFATTPPQRVKPGETLFFKECSVSHLLHFPFPKAIEYKEHTSDIRQHKRQLSEHGSDFLGSSPSPSKVSKQCIDLTSEGSAADSDEYEGNELASVTSTQVELRKQEMTKGKKRQAFNTLVLDV
jgi:hypothetical protein